LADTEQSGNDPGPEVGLVELAIDLPEARVWIASVGLKITGPNLFAPYFSVSALINKQFGRLFSA
jgi:hypothetical protein